ncbi:uncharacterized protein LOC135378827 isoform X2 [Ornithodoros turicata]
MSALINAGDVYSLKQMQLIAEARAAEGVHVVFQNGFQRITTDEGREIVFPNGLTPGVKTVHVFRFGDPGGQSHHVFHMMSKDRKIYLEYAVTSYDNELCTYKTVNGVSSSANYGSVYNNVIPGFHVLQSDIDNTGKIMVQCNGTDIWSTRQTVQGFTLDLFKQLVLHEFRTRPRADRVTDCALMEIHVIKTAQSSPSVFNDAEDFLTPTIQLSPGAYITWMGSVDTDNAVVIKDDTTELFKHTGKAPKLSIMMKVMRDSIIIGEDGKPAKEVAVDRYKVTDTEMNRSKICVSKEFKLTNCFV